MMRPRRELDARLEAIERLLDKVDRSVDRIEIVTVVREPNSAVAADAYNGLRKQIIAATTERNAHLVQLAFVDCALREGVGPDDLAAFVSEWMAQASMVVVADPHEHPAAFEVVGPDDGDELVVKRPAYVDTVTQRVVRTGIAERRVRVAIQPPPPEPPPAPASAPAPVQQRGDGR
jgi:hypothetical protein